MRRRNVWLVVFIALVALWGSRLGLSESSESGASKKQVQHASNPIAQDPAVAGRADCAMCREAETSPFCNHPPAKLALQDGGKEGMCGGGHSAGKEHIDSSGDTSKIFSISRATAEHAGGRCLTCQQGDHKTFEGLAQSSLATS